jgi:hypothetical protein
MKAETPVSTRASTVEMAPDAGVPTSDPLINSRFRLAADIANPNT